MKCNLKIVVLALALFASSAKHPMENRPNTLFYLVAIISGAVGGFIANTLAKSMAELTQRHKEEKFSTFESDIGLLMKDYEKRQKNNSNQNSNEGLATQLLTLKNKLKNLKSQQKDHTRVLAQYEGITKEWNRVLTQCKLDIAWHTNILLSLSDFAGKSNETFSNFSILKSQEYGYLAQWKDDQKSYLENQNKLSQILLDLKSKIDARQHSH